MNEPLSEQEAVKQLFESRPQQETEQVEAQAEPQEEVQEFGENLEAPSEQAEAQAAPEPSDEVQESEADTETEAETYDLGADEFAELLGIKSDKLDISDDGRVRIKVKVGDETSDVTLEDLINAHQGSANLTNRSKEVAAKEKQITQKLSEYSELSNNFAQQAASILEAMKDTFTKPYSDADMKALREDDPAEYAARMEEMRQRTATFNQIAQQAVNLVGESQGTVNEQTQAQYQHYLQQETAKVREAIPEWDTVQKDLVDYAKDIGFSDQEIGMMADSRLLITLHKAMLNDKGKTQVKQQLKRKIPKITKPGKPQPKNAASLERQEKLRSKLKSSGDPNDAVAYIKSLTR